MRELPISLITPDDIQQAILDLDKLERQHQERAVRSKTKATELVISQLIADFVDAKSTTEDIDNVRTSLKTILDGALVVKLVLPAAPTALYQQTVVRWLRHNIEGTILLETEVDRGLAGGFQLWAGGQLTDKSFRKSLLDNRQKIAGLYHGK